MKQTIKKIARFGLKNIVFPLIPPGRNQIVPYDQADRILSAHYPDPKSSCIRKNDIHEKIYDLTVIIPAYNVENYLQQCLDSVIRQSTQYSFEVIVVNDGSTDNTGSILNTYSSQQNFTVIHQENRGLAGARNAALHQVRGEYILFLDSDDYLTDNAVESLMYAAKSRNADIVQGGYYNVSQSGDTCISSQKYDTRDCVPPNGVIAGMSWGKVYRAELFENICFPEGYWYEDTIITSILTHLSSVICTTEDMVCYYRQNAAGITQSSRKKPKSIDTYYVLRSTLDARKELRMHSDAAFYTHLLRLIILGYQRTQSEPEDVKKSMFSLYQKMLLEQGGTDGYDIPNPYKLLDKLILSGDYRRYCFLCSIL